MKFSTIMCAVASMEKSHRLTIARALAENN